MYSCVDGEYCGTCVVKRVRVVGYCGGTQPRSSIIVNIRLISVL